MPLQEVSFIADKPGKPPAPDLPPGVYTTLLIVCGVIGAPSALAVVYQAFENASFLAGGAATAYGVAAGLVGGVLSALGLSMLLVTIGITRDSMRPVALMALALFVVCLVISISAMGSFTWISSKPAPPEARGPNHRPINDIRRDLANAGFRCVYEGIPYHCNWRPRLSSELAAAYREDDAPAPTSPETHAVPGSGVVLTTAAIRAGNYISAWQSHLVILAFASVGAAIALGTARALVTPPQTVPKVITVTPPKDEAAAAFETWASEYLIRAADSDTPTEKIKLAYRISCASRGRRALRGEDFDTKLAAWMYDKFRAVERGESYVGVALIDDAIGQENKALT